MKTRIMLNFASIKNNNNKFYEMILDEEVLIKRYGRVGTEGQIIKKTYGSPQTALREYEKTLNLKTSKGYLEIKTVDTTDNHGLEVKQEKEEIPSDEKVDEKILSFIGYLTKETENFVSKSIKTPLGALTKSQVENGKRILEKLSMAIVDKDDNLIEDLSDEFYRHIPYIFGYGRGSRTELFINNSEKLIDRKELLNAMETLVVTQKINNVFGKYKDLNINLKPLSNRTKIFKELIENAKKTTVHNSYSDFKVNNIYEIKSMNGSDEFNPYKVDTKLLYHGTKTENLLSIMKNGLKTSPPKSAYVTGKMFGNGIYFADMFSKSLQYLDNFGKMKMDKYFMFVCEVATGKEKELTSSNSSLVKAPTGYNSVKGCKGSNLRFNEYIVYNNNQVKLKYILEIELNK